LKKIAIITNVIPTYRRTFYDCLLANRDIAIRIFCWSTIKGMNLSLCHQEFPDHVHIVEGWSLPREQLAWQRLSFLEMLREFDGFVFYGNPRVLSNVFYSLACRIMGRKVGIWGQAHTAGSSGLTEWLRLRWWSLFDNLFVYTNREVDYLREKGVQARNLMGMNNGLDQRTIDGVAERFDATTLAAWRADQQVPDVPILLSCARLEPKNCFDILVEALVLLAARGLDFHWVVIGEGAEGVALRRRVAEHGLEDRVSWLGAIYDEEALAPWFLSASVMVHPAAIGLSLLHAFGYGLPVITHDNAEAQMPEFAAMEDGHTGLLYREGSIESLAEVIANALSNFERLPAMGERCRTIAREDYNVDEMARRFSLFAERMLDA